MPCSIRAVVLDKTDSYPTRKITAQGNNQMLLGNTETGEISRFWWAKRGEVTASLGVATARRCLLASSTPVSVATAITGGGFSASLSIIAINRSDGGVMGYKHDVASLATVRLARFSLSLPP